MQRHCPELSGQNVAGEYVVILFPNQKSFADDNKKRQTKILKISVMCMYVPAFTRYDAARYIYTNIELKALCSCCSFASFVCLYIDVTPYSLILRCSQVHSPFHAAHPLHVPLWPGWQSTVGAAAMRLLPATHTAPGFIRCCFSHKIHQGLPRFKLHFAITKPATAHMRCQTR